MDYSTRLLNKINSERQYLAIAFPKRYDMGAGYGCNAVEVRANLRAKIKNLRSLQLAWYWST